MAEGANPSAYSPDGSRARSEARQDENRPVMEAVLDERLHRSTAPLAASYYEPADRKAERTHALLKDCHGHLRADGNTGFAGLDEADSKNARAGAQAGALGIMTLLTIRRLAESANEQPTGLIAASALDALIDGLVLGLGYNIEQDQGTLLAIALAVEFLFLGLSISGAFREQNSRAAVGSGAIGISFAVPLGVLIARPHSIAMRQNHAQIIQRNFFACQWAKRPVRQNFPHLMQKANSHESRFARFRRTSAPFGRFLAAGSNNPASPHAVKKLLQKPSWDDWAGLPRWEISFNQGAE